MFINSLYIALGVLIFSLSSTLLICSLYRCKRMAQLAILEKDKLTQALVEIAQILSHETKNPLAAILGSVELISRFKSDTKQLTKIDHSISQIKHSVKRIEALTSDLTILIKIESGRIELTQEEVFLLELITETIECFKPLALAKKLQIGYKIHSTCLKKILCDKEKLKQVLSRLMDNAVKFTNQGEIFLQVIETDNQFQFEYHDTGFGIQAQHLSKIFDRFWQAKEFSHQGTGLGLTIAKGIVEAHKGKMWAESTYGQGCSIYFTLPV